MPNNRLVQYRVPPAPVFRKLFRKGSLFVCGVCRSEYHSRISGNNCLNFCWFELQALSPILLLKHHLQGFLYRCQYCARDHSSEAEARICAQDCAQKRNQIHIQEQLLNDLPLADHRPVPIQLIRSHDEIPKKFTPNRATTRTKTKAKRTQPSPQRARSTKAPSQPLILIEQPFADNSQSVEPIITPFSREDEDIDQIVHSEDHAKKVGGFAMENSNDNKSANSAWISSPIGYRCRVCHTIHDTKDLAQQCFAGHLDIQSK